MDAPLLRTGQLTLRPWQPSDAPALRAACQDEEVLRWTTLPSPYTAQDAEAWCGSVTAGLWASGTGAPFAVLGESGLLASVGLHRIGDGQAEVGYWCAAGARGSGVVTAALSAVCGWAFETLALDRLLWFAQVGNWPSRAVAQKCGFTVEGVRRRELLHRGRRVDAWAGSLLAGEPVVDRRPLPGPSRLTDGVVVLRPFRPDDAAAVARACDDPETARWLPVPRPYTDADGTAYVSGAVPQGWADGTAATFAVADPEQDRLLGAVALELLLRSKGVGEVGYWTVPDARGRGVAGRAARLVADWGRDQLGLRRVELLADVDNARSQAAAVKAGFRPEGLLRGARADPGDRTPRDMLLYSRICTDP